MQTREAELVQCKWFITKRQGTKGLQYGEKGEGQNQRKQSKQIQQGAGKSQEKQSKGR